MSDPCISTGMFFLVSSVSEVSRYLWTRRDKHQWVLLRSVDDIIIPYFIKPLLIRLQWK